jgi:hypothetical protein
MQNLKFTVFWVGVVARSFSSERARKMLQNELLDAKKLVDTSGNEAFEVPKMRICRLCYAEPERSTKQAVETRLVVRAARPC